MGFHSPGEWWEIGDEEYQKEDSGFPCCDFCFDGILDHMQSNGSAGMWRIDEEGCVLCPKCDSKEQQNSFKP